MSLLQRINQAFVRFSKVFFVVDSVVICMIVLVNALLRYVFKTECYGNADIVLLCAMWFYFIGSAVATYDDEHITADLIHSSLKSEKAKCLHDIIRQTITLILMIVCTKWVYTYFFFVLKMHHTTSMLKLPTWYYVLSLAISFVLSCLYTLYHIVLKIKALKQLGSGGQKGDNE